MPTVSDFQKHYEKQLDAFVAPTAGQGRDSDWAMVRALIHKAVHLAADRKAAEFCGVATVLAEMIQHAHGLMHASESQDAARGWH